MKKALKYTVWTLVGLIVLVIIAITGALYYFTSDKLTGLVEKYGSEYINGTVEARRVELTFWRTFPRITIDVDSLVINSNTLDSINEADKDLLPPDYRKLLYVRRFSGTFNILWALKGDIKIHDAEIEGLAVNAVVAPSGLANFDLIPPSEPDSSATRIPSITIDRFALHDAGPLTYVSVRDSIDLSVDINEIVLDGSKVPLYRVSLDARGKSSRLEQYNFSPVNVGINGSISWNPGNPDALGLDNVTLSVDDLACSFSTLISLRTPLTIQSLDWSLTDTDLNTLLRHAPAEHAALIDRIDSDIVIRLQGHLDAPYTVGDSATIPFMTVRCQLPPAHFYMGRTRFNTLTTDLTAKINGDSLDRSVVRIDTLDINGHALKLGVSATLTHLLSDPTLQGYVNGNLRLERLPADLLKKLPVNIAGNMTLATEIKGKASDLTRENFHRLYMKGQLDIRNFAIEARDSSSSMYTRNAMFRLGTSSSWVNAGQRVDSMLTMSLRLDTAIIHAPGVVINSSRFMAGLGTRNVHNSSDTTKVNPFGGLLAFKDVLIDSPGDSLTVRFREVQTNAELLPFEGVDTLPRLHFKLLAARIATRVPGFGLAISRPLADIDAHLMPRNPADTARIRGRHHINQRDTILRDDIIDWNASAGLKRLLKRWDITGHLESERGFIFTQSLPLRQRARDIALDFTTDSINLRSLHYSIGRSRLNVTGRIYNIERALAGRSGRSKLKFELNVDAPFIDANELAKHSYTDPAGYAGPDPDYYEDFSSEKHRVDSDYIPAVIIPRNIMGEVKLLADTVRYADMLLNSLTSDIKVDNSAVNLSDLSATSDIGSIQLSALYWAPDTARMEFGMGMQLKNFNIEKMLQLIPAVDSLLPALRGFAGIINADVAATSHLTPRMDIDIPSFKGALKINGDSLVLLDADTFKTLARWLVFKDKKRNMIDHMNVEIAVDNGQIEIFPFIFDIDRYKLGVMGRNDLDMNLNYHVSVLKSPIPFKFGINISGQLGHLKIRLGGAKVKPGTVQRYELADSMRVNLLDQIDRVFRRGAIDRNSLKLQPAPILEIDTLTNALSASDSLLMQQQNLLP